MNTQKRVLLLYTDKYYLIKQIYPFGLNLIANHLRGLGHEVRVAYPFLPNKDVEFNISELLHEFKPDVVGLGLRNIDTCMGCEAYGEIEGEGFRSFAFLPHVKNVVDELKKKLPDAPMIIGGGAFTFAPEAVLRALDLQYGVVGEGETAMAAFVEHSDAPEVLARTPGMVVRENGIVHAVPKEQFAFSSTGGGVFREPAFTYAYETAGLPVQVKRGCNQRCSYCVEPQIEGKKIVYRDLDDVLIELSDYAHDPAFQGVQNVFFVDTEFNVPNLDNCSTLVQKLVNAGLHERFRFSSQFLPKPFTEDFVKLLASAGFSVVLTCDSFSDAVLEQNFVSYRREDILNVIQLCEKHGVPCTINLIFGLPGETMETVDATLQDMMDFPPTAQRTYEYTVGGRVYQGTKLYELAQSGTCDAHLYGNMSEGCLEPLFYCTPKSPLDLKAYIDAKLPFPVEFFNEYKEQTRQGLAVVYLADQKRFNEALLCYGDCDLETQLRYYDYFFRKLADSGEVDAARSVCVQVLERMEAQPNPEIYEEHQGMIWFYLNLVGGPGGG